MGQRLLAGADREHDLVRRRELLRDLKAGVAATDDENRPLRHVVGPAIANGVRLEDIVRELLGELRHVRRLEGPGRDHDLVGSSRPPVQLEAKALVDALLELHDLAAQLDRQVECLGVAIEVGDHLVSVRIAIGVARERNTGQRAVAPGGEERERLPALAPGRPDRLGTLEDHEAAALAAEEVAHRQPCLAGADDSDFHVVASSERCGGLARGTAHQSLGFPTSHEQNVMRACSIFLSPRFVQFEQVGFRRILETAARSDHRPRVEDARLGLAAHVLS